MTSSGVDMSRSIEGTIMIPNAVSNADSRNVSSIVVCTAWNTPLLSCAPYRWEIITLAPVESPMKKPMKVLMTGPVEPTAARASFPTKLPTTMLSTVL